MAVTVIDEGPFETKLQRIGDCHLPDSLRDLERASSFNFGIYNTSTGAERVRGTFNIPTNLHFKVRISASVNVGAGYQKIQEMDNLLCDHLIVSLIFTAVNITMPEGQCYLERGDYSFDHLDIDQLIHALVNKIVYGKLRADVTFYNEVGVTLCVSVQVETKPLSNNVYTRNRHNQNP